MNITQFKEGDTVELCPRCNDELKVRKGKYGLFIGCNNYPACRKTFNYEGFRVNNELIKVKNTNDYSTLNHIKQNTDNDRIRSLIETKLIQNEYCECGQKVSPHRIYRLDPDYPIYLKEYRCPTHGYYITTETRDYASFTRMGRIDDHGDDSHITGGYWL